MRAMSRCVIMAWATVLPSISNSMDSTRDRKSLKPACRVRKQMILPEQCMFTKLIVLAMLSCRAAETAALEGSYVHDCCHTNACKSGNCDGQGGFFGAIQKAKGFASKCFVIPDVESAPRGRGSGR